MAKRKFEITISGTGVIEIDDEVINVVDDAWREMLYELNTPEEIAEHLGYHLIINDAKLTQLDGWADMPNEYAEVKDYPQWEAQATEMKQ